MADSANYASLKEAILRRYNISNETYCQQFRAATLKKGETDGFGEEMKECFTIEELLDLVVREQFLISLSEDATTWVRECKAKSSAEARQLAEVFF